MAWTPNSANELQAGINHVTNSGRANENSIVLDGALQAVSDHWNGTTPHAVLTNVMGGSGDSSFERYSRTQRDYQPGSMTSMTDQIGNGTDDNPP